MLECLPLESRLNLSGYEVTFCCSPIQYFLHCEGSASLLQIDLISDRSCVSSSLSLPSLVQGAHLIKDKLLLPLK